MALFWAAIRKNSVSFLSFPILSLAQSAGEVEYIDCTSAEG